MTTVVPVGKHRNSAACGRDSVWKTMAGVSGNTHRHAAIRADRHTRTERHCAQFQTHEHKHAVALRNRCEDGKMDVESHAEKLTRDTFQGGRRACLHWLLTNAGSAHVAAGAREAAGVKFNLQPCCHKLHFVCRRPVNTAALPRAASVVGISCAPRSFQLNPALVKIPVKPQQI